LPSLYNDSVTDMTVNLKERLFHNIRIDHNICCALDLSTLVNGQKCHKLRNWREVDVFKMSICKGIDLRSDVN